MNDKLFNYGYWIAFGSMGLVLSLMLIIYIITFS